MGAQCVRYLPGGWSGLMDDVDDAEARAVIDHPIQLDSACT
jgi:hypothetical protein